MKAADWGVQWAAWMVDKWDPTKADWWAVTRATPKAVQMVDHWAGRTAAQLDQQKVGCSAEM